MSWRDLPLPNYLPSQHIYSQPSKPTRPIPSPQLRWLIQAQDSQGCGQISIITRLSPPYSSDSPVPQTSPLCPQNPSTSSANSSLSSNFEHFLHFLILIETFGHCFLCCFCSPSHCAMAPNPPPKLASLLLCVKHLPFSLYSPPFKSCH